MADRVELLFRRAALPLLPEGSSVLVAVSGGGDSVALLHLVARLARTRPLRLVVAHLDHGLRRGSASDRRFVEALAAEHGLPCHAARRAVAAARRKRESLEEAARRVRRAFLLETARAAKCDTIALGHTLDDQAETVLLRLVRGAGPSALAGMSPSGPGPFVRPLLSIPRADLRRFCSRRGIEYLDDPSNRDLRFDRNRLRAKVLPLLESSFNAKAAAHLVRAAALLREDAELLDRTARVAFKRIVREERRGRWSLDVAPLVRRPLPIALRIARLALERAGIDPRRVNVHHVEGLLDLARGGRGRRLDLPEGVVVTRTGDRLGFQRRGRA